METFGVALAEILGGRGMSQSELARRTGIPRTVIVEIIGGSDRHELNTYAPRIVDALGAPALRAWFGEIGTEALGVRSAIEDCTAKLDRVEATLDRVEATRRDLRAAAEQAEALSTEVAQAKRMFAAELAALEMGRQLLDKLSERIAALR